MNDMKISEILVSVTLTIFFFLAISPITLGDPGCADQCNYFNPFLPGLNASAIAEYNFNEGSGLITNDDSGRGKTGILVGIHPITGWVNERDNNFVTNAALSFDGNGDYVVVENHVDLKEIWDAMYDPGENDRIVICALIKPVGNKTQLTIVGQHNSLGLGYTFWVCYNGLRFEIRCKRDLDYGVVYHGINLRDGNWHFVAVMIEKEWISLYIDPTSNSDGLVQRNHRYSGFPYNLTYPNTDLYIGRYNWAPRLPIDEERPGWDFHGSIDFVYIYKPDETVVLPWGNTNLASWGMNENNEGIINDRVGWDFNNYGVMHGSTCFVPCVIEENGLEFPGGDGDYVSVSDPNDVFDFTANQGEENFYVEFHFNCNHFLGNDPIQNPSLHQRLISKIEFNSQSPPTDADGWEITLRPIAGTQFGRLYFSTFNGLSQAMLVSSQLLTGNWYHVWAWVINGYMYLHIEINGNVVDNNINCPSVGIGDTSSLLYFGTGLDCFDDKVDFYYGLIDDVSIYTFPLP